MRQTDDGQQRLLSRAQFLGMLGSAVAGLTLGQFFYSSKQTYVKANSYGTSNYGNRA